MVAKQAARILKKLGYAKDDIVSLKKYVKCFAYFLFDFTNIPFGIEKQLRFIDILTMMS